MSERFQSWAAAFPLTRPVVQHHERALFDLCAGFIYSQALLAGVRLRVFEMLREGPLAETELALRAGLPPENMRRLVRALAALDLLAQRSPGVYGLSVRGAALAGNPGAIAMIEHHSALYADLQDPVALLKGDGGGGRMAAYWAYAGSGEPGALTQGDVAAYSTLMAASQQAIADEILRSYPFRRHRCLMDVGGGEGRFVSVAARKAPHLELMLFDLPAVVARARAALAREPQGARIRIHGGSFLDGLPGGADVITLVRILLDHDDETALRILRSVRGALTPGGVVIVAEPMAGVRGAEPVAPYFGLYLLAMGRGRPRTRAELSDLMVSAGFSRVRFHRTGRPLLVSLLVGHV